jgi:hypothetical protein
MKQEYANANPYTNVNQGRCGEVPGNNGTFAALEGFEPH